MIILAIANVIERRILRMEELMEIRAGLSDAMFLHLARIVLSEANKDKDKGELIRIELTKGEAY